MSRLEEFCSKYTREANEKVRCGSCQNILLHCGYYEIVKVEKYDEEGILCETCKKNGREIEIVTIIISSSSLSSYSPSSLSSEDDNIIYQIPLSQLGIELLLEQVEEVEEEHPELKTQNKVS